MNKQGSSLSKESRDIKVYVGTYLPLNLYHRLLEEVERAGISRSEVLRRALAERYGGQVSRMQEARCKMQGDKVQGSRRQGDKMEGGKRQGTGGEEEG